MILAAAQFNPRLATSPADSADNVRRCQPLFHLASRAGVQLLVMPELFATGYSFLGPEQAARVAEMADGPTFRAMSGVAAELQSYVAWGYVESDGTRLYNSACLAGPDGRAVARYRKANLWGNDFLWATSGEAPAPVVQTELGAVSVLVCRDLRDKVPTNVPRTARARGILGGQRADVVAACVNWGKAGFPANQWMDFAADNACHLVVSNRWGEESNGGFVQDFGHGGSCVVEPDWTVHTGGLEFSRDCLVVASV